MISLIRAAWQEEMRVPMFVGLSADGYPDSDDPAMRNGARIYHMDTGSEYEYSIDDDAWYPVSNGSGGASTWNQLSGKPFSAIGDGLSVDSDNSLNVAGEVVDVGSSQYVYESYSLPAIPADKLRTIYANHKDNKTQVIKWTLLGSETYFNVLSADYISGTYSLDILVHNKYHCQYNFDADTAGNVNPEVLESHGLPPVTGKGAIITSHDGETWGSSEAFVAYDADGVGVGTVVSYGMVKVANPDTGEFISLSLVGSDYLPEILFNGQHAGGSLYVDGVTDPYNPRLMYNGKELANTEQVSSAIANAIGNAIGGSY